jgi:hypothetical protein
MRKWTVAVLVLLVITACGSTQTKVIYEKVEIPTPYWNPPTNLKPLPPEIDLQISHMTPGEARADPTATLVVVGQDFNLCLGDLEELRHLYAELFGLCSAPAPTPVPSHPVEPE